MNKEKIKIMLEKLLKEKPSALFAVGLAGILLIGLGSIANGNAGGGGDSRKTADTQIRSAEEYANELEQRLEGLLSQIDGVGKARVMVTLESGYGCVYAKAAKVDNDLLEDYKAEDTKKTQEKQTTEETYILVEGENGEQPLVTMELQPEVRGVVVVCEGGDSPGVAAQVVSTVKVALNISSARISVSKMTTGE